MQWNLLHHLEKNVAVRAKFCVDIPGFWSLTHWDGVEATEVRKYSRYAPICPCQRSLGLSSSEASSAKQEFLQEEEYTSCYNSRSCLMIRSLNKPAMRTELCTDLCKRNNGINSKWSSLSLGIQRTSSWADSAKQAEKLIYYLFPVLLWLVSSQVWAISMRVYNYPLSPVMSCYSPPGIYVRIQLGS